MKLAELDHVNRRAIDRRKLYRLLEHVAADKLTIAIDGERQDEAIVALARVVIERELQARINLIDAVLKSYGVLVD